MNSKHPESLLMYQSSLVTVVNVFKTQSPFSLQSLILGNACTFARHNVEGNEVGEEWVILIKFQVLFTESLMLRTSDITLRLRI